MSGTVWESLLLAPSFESQLRMWIDKIAADRVASRIQEIEQQTREAAHRTGYEAGLEAGKKSLESAAALLHELTTQIAAEKTALLKQHEELFADTLVTVLENLAVPDTRKWTEQIEGLLQRFRAEFSEKARVEVLVSTETWKKLEGAGLTSVEGLRWNVKPSEAVQGSDLHIDFGGVGMQILPQTLLDEWKIAQQGEMKKAG